jgi:cytochrome c553
MHLCLLPRRHSLLFLAFAAVTINTVPARSGESAADIALLTESCSGCHAKNLPNNDFPQIYGRPASEIREAMLAYRSDELSGTVMNRIAKGYSESEIDAMARYLADDAGAQSEDLAN